jgi:NTP pyrophosphatase (non-canonical NTP hydrolase)
MYTLENIKETIENLLDLDLSSTSRGSESVTARTMFYHFGRNLVPGATYQSLADITNRKQHGTVMHSIRNFEFELKHNREFKKLYFYLKPFILNVSNYQYLELEGLVEEWAESKGILSKATKEAQALKTLEECNELIEAIDKDDKDEIIDALGDILVTIIIQAKMQNVSLIKCLSSAYNVISKRTGKMVNGQFQKDV